MKVAVFMRRTGSSTGYIRVILPLFHPSLKTLLTPTIMNIKQLSNIDYETAKRSLRGFDRVLIQRDALDYPMATKISAICKDLKIKLFYEIDDDLLGINLTHPEYGYYRQTFKSIRHLLRNADHVIVSTDPLKMKYQEYNSNISVIGNSLDERLWIDPIEENEKTTSNPNQQEISIGYIGSYTHHADLELIKKPFLNVRNWALSRGIQVTFSLIGGTRSEDSWFNRITIPNRIYPQFVIWLRRNINFDIAVAPLVSHEFNVVKSPFKYLEYTALGCPGIYSNIPPYKNVVRHGENGLIVNNHSFEWENAMRDLIQDAQLRHSIRDKAYNDLIKNYLLKNNSIKWLDVFS